MTHPTHPHQGTEPPRHVGLLTTPELALLQRSWAIARTTVLHDITTDSPLVTQPDGSRWHDTRPLLDPRERGPASIDLSREYLAYALDAGLLVPHPSVAHLVRRP